MKKKSGSPKNSQPKEEKPDADLPGYPTYPASEDIFNKDKEESEIDPENPSKKKDPPPRKKEGLPMKRILMMIWWVTI